MTKMQKLINELEGLNIDFEGQLTEESYNYFLTLKSEKAPKVTKGMTENGAKILEYMQKNYEDCENAFKAKEIGEGIFMSFRSVSGSMRKLVENGYVEKKPNSDPIVYSLTEKGKEKELN